MIQREILKDNNFQIGYKINKFISFAIAVTKSLTKPPYCDQHWGGGGVEGILCVPVCCTDPGPCLVAEILLSPGTGVFSESLTLSFSMRLPSIPLKRVLHIKTSLCSLTSILFSRLERMLSRVLFFLLPQSLPSATLLAHAPRAEAIFPSVLLPRLLLKLQCLPSITHVKGRCPPLAHPCSAWFMPLLSHLSSKFLYKPLDKHKAKLPARSTKWKSKDSKDNSVLNQTVIEDNNNTRTRVYQKKKNPKAN